MGPHRAFTRVLSFLLLGFIVYGTTIEAAHTHGSLTRASVAIGGSTFSDPATQRQPNSTLLGCSDCLICQLHQHFSATVISDPPSIGPAALGSGFFNLNAVAVHSLTATPRTGRAPPQNS